MIRHSVDSSSFRHSRVAYRLNNVPVEVEVGKAGKLTNSVANLNEIVLGQVERRQEL